MILASWFGEFSLLTNLLTSWGGGGGGVGAFSVLESFVAASQVLFVLLFCVLCYRRSGWQPINHALFLLTPS